MCGITGIISRDLNLRKSKIKSVIETLNHRGPDNSNFFLDNDIMFSHNRLSIIDLDKRSNQPMFDKEKENCIVFNGEIYNYIELKKILLPHYNFQTSSDTEVLLAAYKVWGNKMLEKLKGAFAFCIYNFRDKKAFMARDRFGQKPFYYYKDINSFVFSSEIKGIIALGYKFLPNLNSWKKYLINGSTDDSSNTFFEKVYQLRPGEMAEYKLGKFKINRWYNLSENIKKLKKTDIKNGLIQHLKESIELNSRADVPIAISLSGGLDSNLLMSLCYKKKLLKYEPKCFTVNFENFSEKKLINFSTKQFNFKSNFVNFTKNDFLNIFEPITWSLESPPGGLMNFGLSKLSHTVSKQNFKILLSGTGLDEGFGGYEVHHLQYLKNLKMNDPKKFYKHLYLFSKNWGISKKDINKKIENLINNSKTIDGYDLTKKSILNSDILNSEKISYEDFNHNSSLKNSLIDYIQTSKIPKVNRLIDRTSMAHSVETRFPFLEHDLLEYALSLDERVYFLNGNSKSILRYVAKDFLNKKISYHKKISVQTPQTEWLKSKKIKEFIEDLIYSKKFKERGIFNLSQVEKNWKNFLSNETNTSFFIWQIISTEMWFKVFTDKDLKSVNKKYLFE